MIKRLVGYCLLGFLALLGLGAAHAQTVVPEKYWRGGGDPRWYFDKSSPESVCQAQIAYYNTPNYQFDKVIVESATVVACYSKSATGTGGRFSTINLVSCTSTKPYFSGAATGTTSAAACSGTPAPGKCDDKNEFIRRWNYPAGGALTPPPSSWDGCEVQTIKMLVCRKDAADMTYCMWLVKRTGREATGTPDTGGSSTPENPQDPPTNSPPIKPPPAPPGASPCPQGTVQAGVSDDGVPICMGQGSNPNNPPAPPPKSEVTKDETLPDGSIKKTTTTTTTNRDGSTTTNTQTTITRPSGATETSTDRNTSTNSAGQPGRMDTPNEDSNNLCKQNPNLSICRESSVSGTCGQITCVGDAIQCATLRAAAAMQCEQQTDKEALQASPSKALGDQVLSGNDPMKGDIAAALKGTEVDLSKTALDQGGFVGGGSCFPDKTFMVVGKTVTVSFARVCQDIQPLRAAIMACAFIIAYLIVGRSVVQG
jgi:hypothetical protein